MIIAQCVTFLKLITLRACVVVTQEWNQFQKLSNITTESHFEVLPFQTTGQFHFLVHKANKTTSFKTECDFTFEENVILISCCSKTHLYQTKAQL